MASPSMTLNALGNIRSNATILASGTTTDTLDFSTKFEGQVQVQVTFGTVAATSGLTINIFRLFGSGPTADTIAVTSFTIPSTASTTKAQSFALPTGKYQIQLVNTDATNSVTGANITTSTVDSIA